MSLQYIFLFLILNFNVESVAFYLVLKFIFFFVWKNLVPRLHLSFEAQLVAGKSHDLSPVSCPEQPGPPGALSGIAFGRQKHEAELKYPQRIRRLNIFPSNKSEVID